MVYALGLQLDADQGLQVKEHTPPFTRYVVRGIVNGLTLNAILGSL